MHSVIFQCAMANPDRYSCKGESSGSSGSSSSSSSNSTGSLKAKFNIQPAPIDDVMILLKKFTSSMDKATRKVGILGHTAHLVEEALLQAVLDGNNHCNDDITQERRECGDEDLKEVLYIQRLETLLDVTARDTEG